MNDIVEITHFMDLKACDPEQVVSRTGCLFDREQHQYEVRIWGHNYIVDLDEHKIYPKDSLTVADNALMDLFILYFLMKSKNLPVSGQWVSEKDIPGGAGFFRGPHTIPSDLLTKRFSDDLVVFADVCKTLGGERLNLADASFSFSVTPLIPVAVLYWKGDEDFPGQAKLLFDKTIQDHLPLDIIFCLACAVCFRIAKTPAD